MVGLSLLVSFSKESDADVRRVAALAIDMTARNMQDKAKRKGLPWSAAKGFDTFNPVSSFIEKSKVADAQNVRLWLKVRRNAMTCCPFFLASPVLISLCFSLPPRSTTRLARTATPRT